MSNQNTKLSFNKLDNASIFSLSFGLALGNAFFLLMSLGSIMPFLSASEISDPTFLRLAIGALGILVVLLVSARWWHATEKRSINILLIIQIIVVGLVVGLYLTVWSYPDYQLYPAFMQWGLVWTRAFWLPLAAVLGAVALVLAWTPSFIKQCETSRAPVLGTPIVFIATLWIEFVLYRFQGINAVLALQVFFLGIMLVVTGIQLRGGLVPEDFPLSIRGEKKFSESTAPQRRQSLWAKIDSPEGRAFVMTVVPGTLLLIANANIIYYLVPEMNFLPIFGSWLGVLLFGVVAWCILFAVTRSRSVILVGTCIISILSFVTIASEPSAIRDFLDLLWWSSTISIAGIWVFWFVTAQEVTTTPATRASWGIVTVMTMMLGTFYGTISDIFELYSSDFWLAGLSISVGVFALALVDWALSVGRRRKRENRAYMSRVFRKPTPSGNTVHLAESNRWTESPKRRENQKPPTWQYLLVVCLVGSAVAIPPTVMATIPTKASTDLKVLGSPSGDYYLWAVPTMNKIDPFRTPSLPAFPMFPTLRISGARGEHEGAQVVFTPWNVRNLNVWSFEPTGDLKHESIPKAVIPRDNIAVSIMEYIPQLNEQVADRLIPFQRMDTGITANGQRNWPLWIDVDIPRDVNLPAGIYSTTMRFRCRDFASTPFSDGDSVYNERVVEFTLEVEVFNFTMSVERHLDMEIIWGVPEGWESFYQEYRLDPYWPKAPVHSYNYTDGNLSIWFDWDRWEAELDAGFAGGMSAFPVTWHPVGLNWTTCTFNSTYETLLSYYIGNVTNHLAGKVTPWGTPYIDHAYYFVRDEPPPEYYGVITEVAKLVHKASPTLKVMETMNNDLDGYPEEFLEHIDIYCQHLHEWIPETGPTAEQVEGWPTKLAEYRDAWTGPREKLLWVYFTHNRFPCPDTDIYMTGIAPRASIWLAWAFQWDGWLYWSFNWGVDMKGGYGYAGYGESRLVDWGPDGRPLSSQRLELVRDGQEDFEYFALLNASCTALEQAGRASEAAPGRAILDRVSHVFAQPDAFPAFSREDNTFLYQYEQNVNAYYAIRDDCARELNRLASINALSP